MDNSNWEEDVSLGGIKIYAEYICCNCGDTTHNQVTSMAHAIRLYKENYLDVNQGDPKVISKDLIFCSKKCYKEWKKKQSIKRREQMSEKDKQKIEEFSKAVSKGIYEELKNLDKDKPKK